MPIPEFIVELRKHVGHDPLWLSGVSVVVTNDDGHILLTRRVDTGLWAVVSGVLEPGEEPAVAVVREVREETGVEVRIVRLSSVDVTEPIVYPNGDKTQYLDVAFLAEYVSGTPHAADDENLDVRWFSPTALPENLQGSSKLRIDKALNHGPEAWFRHRS